MYLLMNLVEICIVFVAIESASRLQFRIVLHLQNRNEARPSAYKLRAPISTLRFDNIDANSISKVCLLRDGPRAEGSSGMN